MAGKSRADKLKELKMPSKSMAEEEVEMDLEMADLADEDMVAEEDMPADEESPLAMYSDEEILEEMKKRGLMMAEEDEQEMPEDTEVPEEEQVAEPVMVTGRV